MVRFRVALIVVVSLAGLLTGFPALVPVPAAAVAAEPAISWARCGALECSTLTVPLDYGAGDADGAATIDIAVARRPASDPSRRIGSLVVNPGGPGVPAIDYLRASVDSFPRVLRDRFDIVAFDPRGVGNEQSDRVRRQSRPIVRRGVLAAQ